MNSSAMLNFQRTQQPAFVAGDVTVWNNPFSNCQLYTIANAQALLRMEDPAAEFVNISNTVCNKNQVIIDVVNIKPFTSKVEKIFKGHINKRHRYINTTGTPMIQYIIKIRQYIRAKQNPVETTATS